MHICIQSESILTTCGSNSTGSWRWMMNETWAVTADCLGSSWSQHCWVLSLFFTDGQCSSDSIGREGDGWTGCPNTSEPSGVGDPSGIGLVIVPEDLLRSGTVPMEKVSTLESSTASHCPQQTISASLLQLRNFLFNSVLTWPKERGVIKGKWLMPLQETDKVRKSTNLFIGIAVEHSYQKALKHFRKLQLSWKMSPVCLLH